MRNDHPAQSAQELDNDGETAGMQAALEERMSTTQDASDPYADERWPVLDYNPYLTEPAFGHILTMDQLREQYPIFKTTMGPGFWNVTRMDAVCEALQDPAVFSSSAIFPIEPDPKYSLLPLMLDPPLHTRWRQLLAPWFSPGAVGKLEGKVRQRCIDLIEPLVDRGRCDFLHDFAYEFPTTIFLEMMGLPLEDAGQFQAWEDAILHSIDAYGGQAALKQIYNALIGFQGLM